MATTWTLAKIDLLGTDTDEAIAKQLGIPVLHVKKKRVALNIRTTSNEYGRSKQHKEHDLPYALLLEINKEKRIPLIELVQRVMHRHCHLFCYSQRGQRAKEKKIINALNTLLRQGYVARTDGNPVNIILKKAPSIFIEDKEYVPFVLE